MSNYDHAKSTRDINLVALGTAYGARLVLMTEARSAYELGNKQRAASLVRSAKPWHKDYLRYMRSLRAV